jgi:hypothetical protein
MTYDAVRGKLVMLGASAGDAALWDWEGTGFRDWPPLAPRPDADDAGLTFDSDRGRLVLFRGEALWELDPNSKVWEQIAERPAPRH